MVDKDELEMILDKFAGMKTGKRNSSADVDRLKKIQALVGELLSDEQAEPPEPDETGSGGLGYVTGQDLAGKAAELAYMERFMKRNKDPNVGGGVDRDKIPGADFAGKDRSYPIVKPGDVSDAASSIGRAGPSNYSTDQLKKNIIRIAKRKGPAFVAELPEVWKKEEGLKSIDLSYAKALGLVLPGEELFNHLAVKRVSPDAIHSYSMIWGSPDIKDVELEFFTPETDFWDKAYGKTARPLTYDHAQDPSFEGPVQIGTITDFGDDKIGRWYEATLDRAHLYRKAIDRLIEEGAFGSSSDSVLQYIERQKTKSGATWLKTWPWIATALTTTPAEPRLMSSVDFKSLGILMPNPEATEEQAREKLQEAKRQIELLRLLT